MRQFDDILCQEDQEACKMSPNRPVPRCASWVESKCANAVRALYNQLAPIRSEHALWLEIVPTSPSTTAKTPEELRMPF
jgi:hypothetical protein